MASNFKKQIIPNLIFSTAVHIPSFISQAPESKLSYAAKILYGRLCILSDNDGIVDTRPYSEFELIGMKKNKLKKTVAELVSVDLIELIKDADECISCKFYTHKWMNGDYDE